MQTCRGSHTHTVVTDPKDKANVYIYVSGLGGVRSPNELPGCVRRDAGQDPNSALFRIEVIRVPLAAPSRPVVARARIFALGTGRARAPQDLAAGQTLRRHRAAAGAIVVQPLRFGAGRAAPDSSVRCSTIGRRAAAWRGDGRRQAATARRCQRPRRDRQREVRRQPGGRTGPTSATTSRSTRPIGLAGGACEGYGLLLDIKRSGEPERIAAVADSNFSYWHSATFNNDGTKILFSDEWGGGGAPKCRVDRQDGVGRRRDLHPRRHAA